MANLEGLPRFEDFSFKVGTDGDPAGWDVAPVPTYINVYPGRGPGGSTQITIIWADNAIENEWLQVTLLANEHTHLAADDVFSFGNLVGETGDPAGGLRVSALDMAAVKRTLGAAATVTSPTDFNRDGLINALDLATVKRNLGRSLATTPASPAALALPPTPEQVNDRDRRGLSDLLA